MNKRLLLSIILIVLSLGLAILAYIVMPETVVVQFSLSSAGNSTAPKLVAILVSTALGVGGAVFSILNRENVKSYGKSLIVSVVGVCLCVFMIVVNTLVL